MRLDKYLVDIGEFDSRQKAQEAIREGRIICGGKVLLKPSAEIAEICDNCGKRQDCRMPIEVIGEEYISRAGKKLQGFLTECERLGIAMAWNSAVDVGASRGGFTQVLLRYGVQCIYCVDVGSNQLHPTIAQDSRVKVFEQCDIRNFTRKHDGYFDIAVCDVSFISIKYIIDDLCKLSDEIILLFKPQFEVGRSIKRNKKGVVQDEKAVQGALRECVDIIGARGFYVRIVTESIIKGKEGNAEFFIYACR